jgi:hypothetical protein
VLVLRFKDKIYSKVSKLNSKPNDLERFILRINLGFQDKFYGKYLRPLINRIKTMVKYMVRIRYNVME